jgi:hypothetical protein
MNGWVKESTAAVMSGAAVLVALERDLLLSSLSRPAGSPPPIFPAAVPAKAGAGARAAAGVIALVRKGDFVGALQSPAAKALLGVGGAVEGGDAAAGAGADGVAAPEASPEAAAAHFAALEAAVAAAGAAAADAAAAAGADPGAALEPAAHELLVLAVGVAALSAFTQAGCSLPARIRVRTFSQLSSSEHL